MLPLRFVFDTFSTWKSQTGLITYRTSAVLFVPTQASSSVQGVRLHGGWPSQAGPLPSGPGL